MVAEINNILSNVIWPDESMAASHRFNLGNSFTENERIKKLLSLIETKNVRKPARGIAQSESSLPLTSETKFYLFVLIVNFNFDSVKGRIHAGFESMISSFARVLNIDETDYRRVLAFYSCNTLYSDTDQCIYISPEKSNPLLKARGINVHFKNKERNRVVYLKFFSGYNIYLVKNFYFFRPYNTLEDDIRVEEINIVSEKLSPLFEYAMFSFKELRHEVENFHPLQHIQVYGNDYLPSILLDPHKSLVTISGSSAPLSVTSYFEPVLEWINIFKRHGKKKLRIYLSFDYFNTYTTRFLIDFVALCKKVSLGGKEISFFWYYDFDDEESLEFGQYLQNHFSKKENFHLLENSNIVHP